MHEIKKKHGCDPVVELILNLYGHPKAGLYWEQHCHAAIERCGFEKIDDWECLFKHAEKKLFLSVYVDDFKMAGKAEHVSDMWKDLGEHGRGKLILDEPTTLCGNVYLGSEQIEVDNDWKMINEKTDLFKKLVGIDDKDKVYYDGKVISWEYSMRGHQDQSVERYCELGKVDRSTLKPVATPCIDDHQLNPSDFEVQGKLKPDASKIVLKCLY